jgi:HD-GYP domain-containing protein (c-di-GMP phosphodiesterase class II)
VLRRQSGSGDAIEEAVVGVLVRLLDLSMVSHLADRSARTAGITDTIAVSLGLRAGERELLQLAARLHDVGMVCIPWTLIAKPGPLTTEERQRMESHSVWGDRLLRGTGGRFDEVAHIVRHHHERYDGTGYPDGLAGEAIPLLSRVLTVADAFDAMTTDAPYRDALPVRVARLRLVSGRETQFDPNVVEVFERLLAEHRLD